MKDKLKTKLRKAQDDRKKKDEQEETKESAPKRSNKKVFKKPVPNFGGGKLGTAG